MWRRKTHLKTLNTFLILLSNATRTRTLRESQTAWNSKDASHNIWSRLHCIYKMPNFGNFFISESKFKINPNASHWQTPFDHPRSPPALKSALVIILANGNLNTLMNQDGVDDRYPIRWLTTVNRISCGRGFWPWFRGTPLKEWLVSAVSGADSAGVSPQPGPFRWSLF